MRGVGNGRGFTLLEVMVAVAILGLALTAIFSSEAGSIKVAQRARKANLATLLARCKMGEIEEQVFEEGLPAISDEGTDECCEGAEIEGFACEWRIERVVMPQQNQMGEKGEGKNAAQKLLSGQGESEDEDAENDDEPSEDPIEKLKKAKESPESVQEVLSGSMGQDMLAQMAFDFAFPVLKPALENQMRRATVTVEWQEGDETRSFDVVQFLVQGTPIEDGGQGNSSSGSTTSGNQGSGS